MSLVSTFRATAAAGSGWHWLLRRLGVEAWFRRVPVAAGAGRQASVLLLLSLAPPARHDAQATLCLESALQGCLPGIRATGGAVLAYQAHTLLLSWPASHPARAVQAYFQLRHHLSQLAPALGPLLCGAASLGLGRARGRHYRGEVARQVAGMLPEAQQLGGLLITAALRQRLPETEALSYTLHVAFGLSGHRYPATLYRAAPGNPLPPAA